MRSTHEAIVLRRTDYGEGDRIINLLTPDLGKVSAMAKGVRKPKSKLAGGIEPFSLLNVSLLRGRSELYTLVSSQMVRHYDAITLDYTRLTLASLVLKRVNQLAETLNEPSVFELLKLSLEAINDDKVSPHLAETWFHLQYLRVTGHALNTQRDSNGQKLAAEKRYNFSLSDMVFVEHPSGEFGVDHLKLLRLMETQTARTAGRVSGVGEVLGECAALLRILNEAG
ncbi:DNA repair protein RecO [Candidatus Saccharibacteria bacterium]|nr:DNA repair protein RecO [Candidatus Saccharibacteria bacterium]